MKVLAVVVFFVVSVLFVVFVTFLALLSIVGGLLHVGSIKFLSLFSFLFVLLSHVATPVVFFRGIHQERVREPEIKHSIKNSEERLTSRKFRIKSRLLTSVRISQLKKSSPV